MNPKFIGVQPKEVIWKNLTITPAGRISRSYIANVFVAAIIIFWSIPIAIVGALSNISYLTDKVKFLGFINNLPDPILGLLTGLLPPFLLGLFVSYVPYFFRCEFTLGYFNTTYAKNIARHCQIIRTANQHPG